MLLWRLVHSPFGRVLKAIKQNETRARFVGYHVWRYKAAVLVVSAGLSGLAGALRNGAGLRLPRRHEPALFGLRRDDDAGRRRARVLLGPGDRRRRLLLVRDVIGALTTGWMLWFGLLFVGLVLFKPEGLAGLFQSAGSREEAARQPCGAAQPQPR